jgi:outer membrane receptor protein involved in Fe transport
MERERLEKESEADTPVSYIGRATSLAAGTENIQDVPIAVSAVTAERIRERAITELAQVGRLMPNVEFENNSTFARFTSVLSAYVRGIGQNGAVA